MFTPSRRKSPVLIVGARRSAQDLARGRIVFLSVAFMLAYLVIGLRVADLTMFRVMGGGGDGEEGAVAESAPAAPQPLRADITDRNGVLLATSLNTESLYADPARILDPDGTAAALAKIFPEQSVQSLHEKLTGKRRFVWVRRNLTPAEQEEVLQIGDPGLDFRTEPQRIYPQGALAAHIVGYSDVDGDGLAGLERGMDAQLRSGKPVASSIDIRIQHALRRETGRAMTDFNAKAGAGVVLDIKTGEVLAAVSLPDFDPNIVGDATPEEQFNRVTLGVYELGSMFKIFSTAALLEVRKVDLAHTFDASKPLRRAGFKISDFHPEARPLTVPEVFIYSSNIGAALMGEMVGTHALHEFYGDLGLTAPLKMEVEETGMPLLPDPWRDINTLTASYGHGIAVSPMQLAAAVATITGDGRFVNPTFLDASRQKEHEQGAQVVSPVTARKMRQIMRLAVLEGTGGKADVSGYRVGGKTGTSEKNVAGRYNHTLLMSSFIGVFPAEDPRYAVLVVIDEPKPNAKSYGYATGGWVAAPAVGRIVAAMGAILDLDMPLTAPEEEISAPLKRFVHKKGEEETPHHVAPERDEGELNIMPSPPPSAGALPQGGSRLAAN